LQSFFVNENRPSCDGLAKEEELKKLIDFRSTNQKEGIACMRRAHVVEKGRKLPIAQRQE
jgi:hypothetical protein